MQRMILYPLSVLILLAITATCHAQNIFWLNGTWQGKAYLPGSDASQNYTVKLKVYNIKGNKFEGIIEIMQPFDTAVRFDSQISGIVFDKYLVIKREKILYVKNGSGIEWKVSCNNCKPPRMIFSIEKGKFFFRGKVKDCYKECNGITEFSKDITEFDSSAKASVYALANEVQQPEASTTSVAENNPSVNNAMASSSQEDNSVAQRITIMPAGSVTLPEHNTTLASLKEPTSSLQENLTMKIKESAPKRIPVLAAGSIVLSKQISASIFSQKQTGSLEKIPSLAMKESEPKRIPVLAPGTIVLSRHNAPSLLSQKQTGSLYKIPSIIIKESEPKRIPVLAPGTIAQVKHNIDLLLHQKQSYFLLKKTPSTIIKEPEQKRIRVLSAGPIALSKHNTNLLLPQKQSFSLQHTTPSIILKEAEQKRVPVLPAGDIVSKPVRHDTIAALPAGYAERKKNVIRTLLVNTDSIVLRVYDNGVVDGDIVSVIYNDQVVIDKLSLTSRAVEIKIPLNKSGINNLVFHAHNLGEFPPNTAKLEILYGNKKEELTVASDLTVSSTIDIVRTQ